MRRTWVCCPPNGRGTGECRRASVRRKGRGFSAGGVRRRRTVDTEHRRDVLAKEACFANRSVGNRFRRLRGFLYTPEPDALFPKRPSPVRIIFGRNPCTDQKNVLHLHTDSRSSGFAVETVDVAQSVRVTDCGSEGRGFEPHLPPEKAFFGRPFFIIHKLPRTYHSEYIPKREIYRSSAKTSSPETGIYNPRINPIPSR